MRAVIETKGLTKYYGKQVAVSAVSLHVPKGKIYGLLGRNGAGKTTIMKMLLSLISVSEGQIFLFGECLEHKSKKQLYHRIGTMIEAPGFYENLTAEENLRLLQRLRGDQDPFAVEEALKVVNLLDEPNKPFADYSLGMKQRLGLAAAIVHKPELLILDEPTNGLDPIGIALVRELLLKFSKEYGTTILISSHILKEIEEIADVVGVIKAGKLIEEIEMHDLKKRLATYTQFTISHQQRAISVLNQVYPDLLVNVQGKNEISVQVKSESEKVITPKLTGEINRTLIESDVMVTGIKVYEESLETYFSNLIGGDELA